MKLSEAVAALIEEPRKFGTPRLHGNGFIQLDLDKGQRLHVWSDSLPQAQRIKTRVHDHKFGFHSEVILGTLLNFSYGFVPHHSGTMRVYSPVPRKGEDTRLEPTDVRGMLVASGNKSIPMGSSYDFPLGAFHDTGWYGLTATIMTKTDECDVLARVLCSTDLEPDNDFDRYQWEPEMLWGVINMVRRELSPLWGFC